MKLSVLSPVHANKNLLAAQIDNYSSFIRADLDFYFHPSISGRPEFESLVSDFDSKNVCITDESWRTDWNCIFSAFIAISNQYLQEISSSDFVLLHTDADLLVREGLEKWIIDKEYGFTAARLVDNKDWFHHDSVLNDSLFKRMIQDLSLSENDVYFGRQEGAFMPTSLWTDIMSIVNKYYTKELFASALTLWPFEEVVVPTLAKYLIGNKVHVGNAIKTKPIENTSIKGNPRGHEETSVEIKDISDLLNNTNSHYFGIKWFEKNLNNPARQYVNELASK